MMVRVMITFVALALMAVYVAGQQQPEILQQRPLDDSNIVPFQGGEGQLEGLQDPALEPEGNQPAEGLALTRKARTFGSVHVNYYPRPYYYTHYPRYYSTYSTYYRPYYHRYYW